MSKRIYLSPPYLGGHELPLVKEAFDSNWIAPLGPHITAFENEIADYLGISHAAALSTGSASLHLSLRLLGVSENDIVFCSSLTFSSCANVILYEKAIPVFIDSEKTTWNMSPVALEKALFEYRKKDQIPKAVIVVDVYGQSADYKHILKVCSQYGVPVIEDAAESLGATYNGEKSGTFGIMGILSFNGNKIITTSGGGMLVSNDRALIEKARFLATQAREPEIHYEHKKLGYNYRMSNILAAIGRGQLQVLEERISARRAIFQRYYLALSDIEGIEFMPEADYACPAKGGGRSTRWLTTLTIGPVKTGVNRTQIINALEKENIEARPVWKPMHLQPLYKDCDYITIDEEDVSGRLFENGLCLPSGSNLSETDQNRIIDIIFGILPR